MDVRDDRDDTSVVFNASERILPDNNVKLKRKRAVKVINSAKKFGTGWEDSKRAKLEGAKLQFTGSVTYNSFSPEAYGWPSKVSVQDACNFRKSGVPSRFMYYVNGEWKDFSGDATAILRESFTDRKSSTELSVDGKRYLVNFVQMLQLNLLTGFLRSVAWIDEHGKCFFPSKFFEGHGTRFLSQLQDSSDNQLRLKLGIRLTSFNSEDCVRSFDSCHDGLIGSCTEAPKLPVATNSVVTSSETTSDLRVGGEALGEHEIASVRGSHDFALLGDKLIKLDEGDREYTAVLNRFMAGLGMLATYTTVVGIHRDSHTSTSGQARLHAFRKQEEITRKARGDANVRYAWHGTSKQGVSGIVLHGFGQPRIPKNGAMYGVGVYLAPEDYSHVSAVYSDVDENGEQHMVLCQAIMGNMEQVCPGSEQFHPTSEDYDTGVDDMSNPKRYIIWSTHMNSHILPQYVVSFKLSPQWHDVMAALRGKQTSGRSVPIARGPRLDGQGAAEPTQLKVGDPASASSCTSEKDTSANVGWSTQKCSNRAPRSPWMSFPMLFLVMKSKLPPQNMAALQQHYLEFKAGRMSREVLIKNVRAVAGDRILADSIKSMQAQEKANQNFNLFPNAGVQYGMGVSKVHPTKDSSNEELLLYF